jgi:hypothetical protein
MLGREDSPPSAGPEAIEDHVRAHDEAMSLVAQKPTRLELRQDPLGDQPLGQGPRFTRILAAADLVADLFELSLVQDARAPDRWK